MIGADGSQSFVRRHFSVPFHIVRPEIIWAVIDGVIDSDFPKVPEIIVFQAETSDVAWILAKVNRSLLCPYGYARFHLRAGYRQN